MAETNFSDVAPVLQPEPDLPPPQAHPEKPAPAEATAASARPAPAGRSGGFGRFMGLTFGGIVAAGLGFGLATYGTQQGWPLLATPKGQQDEVTALRAQLDILSTRLTELEARPAPTIPDIEMPDLAPLQERISALEARPPSSGGSADLGPLTQRIETLETRVEALKPADRAAIAAEIEGEIKAQIADRLDAATAEAEALTSQAEAQAAVIGLRAALTSGQGLPEAEAAIRASAIELPEPVRAYLADPVALSDLQAGFPEVARAALADARNAARADGSLTDRMAVFLLNQTGARSAAPREGNDPDAVLSRAEAALDQGDLDGTLALLAALPEAAKPALSDWTAKAVRLQAAQSALTQFTPAQ